MARAEERYSRKREEYPKIKHRRERNKAHSGNAVVQSADEIPGADKNAHSHSTEGKAKDIKLYAFLSK